MNPKKIWANLAVSDLDRTTKFYTEAGFKFNGQNDSIGLTSFLFGENNFVIHFFLKDKLRTGMQGEIADLKNGNEIIFTLSAESREEADKWAKEIEKAGGTLVSQPEEFGKGYYGFVFADPDGHKFNVFYAEGM